jgi:hypothetical protein
MNHAVLLINLLAALANVAIAVFTLKAARAAARSANATATTADHGLRAAKVPVIETLRSQQPDVSSVNQQLTDLVRNTGAEWLKLFADSKDLRGQYAAARRKVKYLFMSAHLYNKSGIITDVDVSDIISRTNTHVFIDIVEPMERVTNPEYDQRPFITAARIYNHPRYSGRVKLISSTIPVEYPSSWEL